MSHANDDGDQSMSEPKPSGWILNCEKLASGLADYKSPYHDLPHPGHFVRKYKTGSVFTTVNFLPFLDLASPKRQRACPVEDRKELSEIHDSSFRTDQISTARPQSPNSVRRSACRAGIGPLHHLEASCPGGRANHAVI